VQLVAEWSPVCLLQDDMRAREDPRQLLLDELDTPFDLARGPLLRARLVRVRDDRWVLLLTMHHVVFDGASAGVLYHELRQLYAAFSAGSPSPLTELSIQYADYALWQREWLGGDVLERELAYWKERLAGAATLDLPTDRPRRVASGHQGSACTRELPLDLAKAVRELSRRQGATPFMTMLAAFQLLLHRYSGQDDILVGSPVTLRRDPELESLIGYFVNMVVMRTDLSGDPTFLELIARASETALGAVAHGEVPFDRVVQDLQPRRDPTRNPLFQAAFTLERLGEASSQQALPGLQISVVPDTNTVSRFDLEAFVEDQPGGMILEFLGRRDLFEPKTVELMLGHYCALLEAAVAEPERPVSELSMLTPAERQRLVVDWNRTEVDYPDTPMAELFREQVERGPERLAVTCGEQSLTYRELDRSAGQLAGYLERLGVGPGVRVGICVERGVDMVVGLLGILRAGAAYVPLDPAYPRERIAFMLEDSGASVLVTQDSLLASLPQHTARVLSLDGDREVIAAEPTDGAAVQSGADDLAYVIYTSGSTGRPKGVQVPQRALSNFLHAMADRPGLCSDDVLLAVTTLCFDIAMLELLLPLVVGGRVVVASREVAVDPARLARVLESSGATVMQATPATWRMLVASGWPGLPQLAILCGGEALPRDLADALLSRGRCVWNLYGPTETTIWSTVCQIRPGEENVSIGRPIANTRVYVLDDALRPVPLGAPGELYIGGQGVSSGYFERPELTRQRFVPDPFSDAPDARLYRTGDRVRFRPDGDLEYLGRLDHQVKLRGFRIELGEVEATLRRHALVREAAAVVREDVPGDARMAAYVVPAGDDPVSAQELRQFVRTSLPEYMVPSSIVFLDALPQTPNGKVDRRALPAPERGAGEQDYVAPRTAAEALLAELWCDVLDLERVSVYDHFFDLGGHSMLTISVIARFEEKTGFRLDPVDFFQQTLAQIASTYEPFEQTAECPATDGTVSYRLEPFLLSSNGRSLFALQRVATRPRGRGVLLCHPHAHEYDRCHRAHRELALRLTRRGYHTLSFDYSGCGDSAGDYEEARLRDWCGDVSAAMDALKLRRGLERITVVGTRLGATLAMLAAAERDDVDALVLWQPVVRGSVLVEQYQKLGAAGAQPRGDMAGDLLDVAGYPLTRELEGDLAGIDLTGFRDRSASHVLVIENAPDGEPETLREFARSFPGGSEYRRIGDAGVWLRDLYESVVPVATVQALVRWIEEVHP
jgi:amino acid adenylation domain-containing protein